MKKLYLSTFIAFFYIVVNGQNRFYVDVDATGNSSGTSWSNAFTELQSALDAASKNDVIWMAEGTYHPTVNRFGSSDPFRPNSHLFVIDENIKIYGGFDGTETSFDQRKISEHKTIVSGEIGTASNTDNSSILFMFTTTSFSNPITNDCILDGLEISDAYQSNAILIQSPQGACDPIIQNCTFINNEGDIGAAISVRPENNTRAHAIIRNCNFSNNTAGRGGALALYNRTFGPAEMSIINCTFSNNTAQIGGAIYVESVNNNSNAFLNCRNSIIYDNSSSSSIPHSENVFVAPNAVGQMNSFVYLSYSTLPAFNTISGVINEGFNSITNPLLVDPVNNNLKLQNASDAIDSGNSALNNSTTDIEGLPRILGDAVDKGAHERLNRIYVDKDATGTGDGTSWTNAYSNLDDALEFSRNKDRVWIAEGTYIPSKDLSGNANPANSRAKMFYMTKNLALLGGFNATEEFENQRNPELNQTILSGEINTSSPDDNCFHVLYVNVGAFPENLTSQTEIDGLTITKGTAGIDNSLSFPTRQGGGILFHNTINGRSLSPIINNCLFTQNSGLPSGGGIAFLSNATDSYYPTITNCEFTSNNGNGGGIALNYANATSNTIFENCIFINNKGNMGSAIDYSVFSGVHNLSASNTVFRNNQGVFNSAVNINSSGDNSGKIEFVNSVFTGNDKRNTQTGAAVVNINLPDPDLSFHLTNCTFSGNTSRGGIYATLLLKNAPQVYIQNTIMWDGFNAINRENTASMAFTKHSIINDGNQDGLITLPAGMVDQGNNIDMNPQFDDLSLLTVSPLSPALDSGLDGVNLEDLDLAGNPRIVNAGIDIGAYEVQCNPNAIVYVKADATGNNDGTSWANAHTSLQDAIEIDRCGYIIWVAKGTYKPTKDITGNLASSNQVTFDISRQITVIGGFEGNEPPSYDLDLRNFTTNKTTLSGNTGLINESGDNAEHVLTAINASTAATLDGFTIMDGNATTSGGGTFSQNSNHSFINCNFSGNTAGQSGAGIYTKDSNVDFNNCSFSNNNAPVGSSMYFEGGNITFKE